MHKITCYFVILIFITTNPIWGSCSKIESIQAEVQASTLRTWNEIHISFTRYSFCDDGAIAEGYSESISQMLANHWDQLNELDIHVKKDAKFYDFIIKHIDQTISDDVRSKILENAQKRCQPKYLFLCKKITSRANQK